MIVRSLVWQGRTAALFTPSISSQICRRAFLSTDASTPPPPTQTLAAAAAPSPEPSSATNAARGYQRPGNDRSEPLSNEIAENFITMTRVQKKTGKLGSVLENRYQRRALIQNPPSPKDVTLELLMASQTHLGHNTSLWNPGNSRYIEGVRAGMHIISLEQTAAHLRRAARVVEEVAYYGGLILFVGTRRGHMDIVVRAAELAGGYHLFSKWMPGTITNRDMILSRAPVRVVDEHDNDITNNGFRGFVDEHRPLVPDLVIALNPVENYVMLRECAQESIPTIGLIDTDADPGRVTYAIPGNDDSWRSAAVVAGVLGRAGEIGQKRRKRALKEGIVTWTNSEQISRYVTRTNLALQGVRARRPRRSAWSLAGGPIF